MTESAPRARSAAGAPRGGALPAGAGPSRVLGGAVGGRGRRDAL